MSGKLRVTSLDRVKKYIMDNVKMESNSLIQNARNKDIFITKDNVSYLIKFYSQSNKYELVSTIALSILTIALSIVVLVFNNASYLSKLDYENTTFSNSVRLDHFSEIIALNESLKKDESKKVNIESSEELLSSFNELLESAGNDFKDYIERGINKYNHFNYAISIIFLFFIIIVISVVTMGLKEKRRKKNLLKLYDLLYLLEHEENICK